MSGRGPKRFIFYKSKRPQSFSTARGVERVENEIRGFNWSFACRAVGENEEKKNRWVRWQDSRLINSLACLNITWVDSELRRLAVLIQKRRHRTAGPQLHVLSPARWLSEVVVVGMPFIAQSFDSVYDAERQPFDKGFNVFCSRTG